MMSQENIDLIPKVLQKYQIKVLDLTGGAPEMHPNFLSLIKEARKLDVKVIDRCNLTILNEPGYEGYAEFLASNKVEIIASLPCYLEENVDKQRGNGVFAGSIKALKRLNEYGYGRGNEFLDLNLVYNPQGTNLPPEQNQLEATYKEHLNKKYGITFTNLYTITNMPIKRFEKHLKLQNQLDNYYSLLIRSFNKDNLEKLMCKTLISVDWEGKLYDCDFNQQLRKEHCNGKINLSALLNQQYKFEGKDIYVAKHCYGCTAGSGSSCSGSLT